MKQVALITAFCLLSGLAVADFELQDPALVTEEEANAPVVKEIANYAIEGAGDKSCKEYLSDREKKGSMFYIDLNWAKGFITGVNYIHMVTRGSTQLGAGLDLEALTLWIDNHCAKNPGTTLSDASAALVDELMH